MRKTEENITINEELNNKKALLEAKKVEYNKLVLNRQKIKELLIEENKKIDQLILKVERREQAVNQLLASYNEVDCEMQDITVEMINLEKNIHNIMKRQPVIISVYNNEITVTSDISFEKDDVTITPWEDVFTSIIMDDAIQSLTIKEMRTLSKVLAIIMFLKEQEIEWQLECDNSIITMYIQETIS